MTLSQIAKEIPPGVHWVLEVKGYTGATVIHTPRFPSNWGLSALRAINVVQFLIQKGIPQDRRDAVGFGARYPLDGTDTADAYAKNRCIEFQRGEC